MMTAMRPITAPIIFSKYNILLLYEAGCHKSKFRTAVLAALSTSFPLNSYGVCPAAGRKDSRVYVLLPIYIVYNCPGGLFQGAVILRF